MVFKIFIRLIIYGGLAIILFPLYSFYIYSHPARLISQFRPGDFGFEYEDVLLKTRDGLKLTGWFIPQKNSNKAIIICHGYPMDKGDVLDLAAFLTPQYNLLLFDFRAMGRSSGKFSTAGWREREDFFTAVRFLKDKGFNDIGAFGFSMGGAVILMANSPDIKAIVSDCAYANLDFILKLIFQKFGFLRGSLVKMMKFYAWLFFQIDLDKVTPLKYISQIKIPIFLIHGELDRQIPLKHAQLLHEANSQSELWIIPGADHTAGFAIWQQEYQNRVLRFFARYL